jgi:hypothetical protein
VGRCWASDYGDGGQLRYPLYTGAMVG